PLFAGEPALQRGAGVWLDLAPVERIEEMGSQEAQVLSDIVQRGVRVEEDDVVGDVDLQLAEQVEAGLYLLHRRVTAQRFELPLAGILDADEDAQEAEILEEQQVLPVAVVGPELQHQADVIQAVPADL